MLRSSDSWERLSLTAVTQKQQRELATAGDHRDRDGRQWSLAGNSKRPREVNPTGPPTQQTTTWSRRRHEINTSWLKGLLDFWRGFLVAVDKLGTCSVVRFFCASLIPAFGCFWLWLDEAHPDEWSHRGRCWKKQLKRAVMDNGQPETAVRVRGCGWPWWPSLSVVSRLTTFSSDAKR